MHQFCTGEDTLLAVICYLRVHQCCIGEDTQEVCVGIAGGQVSCASVTADEDAHIWLSSPGLASLPWLQLHFLRIGFDPNEDASMVSFET